MSFLNLKRNVFLSLSILVSTNIFANQPIGGVSDRPVSVIYTPTFTVNPDENQSIFPHAISIKLIIDIKGNVIDIHYPQGTNDLIKSKIYSGMMASKFMPYLKNGKPVKSIVPYTVSFYFLSEEEYGQSHLYDE